MTHSSEGNAFNDRELPLIEAACEQVKRLRQRLDATASGAPTVPSEADRSLPASVADSIAGYEVVRELHRGGQGVVYQAVQKTTNRKVAVKVMREGPFASPRDRARFEREVQILGQLNHPNIVAVHDSGEVAGAFYYVMDYISGRSLTEHLADDEHPIDETLRLFAKICDAVNAAHLRGVIHRDLKPSNIRIDADGEPHILDFGLAKVIGGDAGESGARVMTLTGQFLGSLPWASPEQAEGVPAKIDIRTDVYSLGVVLYQMLTGRFPYEVAGNMRDVLDNILRAEPTKPSTIRRQINNEVETIVLKSLSKERERRYQSAGELARDIRHYLAGEPIEAKRASGVYLLRKSLARHRRELTGVAAVIVVVAVATTVVARHNARLRAREDAIKLVHDAEVFIREGTDLSRAQECLDDAVGLWPEHDRVYIQRGFLHAKRGLATRAEDKARCTQQALADFGQAHLMAGGRLFDEISRSTPLSVGRAARGSITALRAAADVLTLAGRAEEARPFLEEAQMLTTLRTPGSARPAHTRLPPIYSADSDPLVGSVPDEPPEAAHLQPDTEAVLHRALPTEVSTLHPLRVRSYGRYVTELLFDPLFVVGADGICLANPHMVESAHPSADGFVWTVVLRAGLTWHDGAPFTAHDVAFTWSRFIDSEGDRLSNVRAIDDRTVEFVHKELVRTAQWDMCFDILPRHAYEALGGDSAPAAEDEFETLVAEQPIGNGPFKYVGRPSPQEIVVARWEDYAGPKPLVARIVFHIVKGDAERLRMLADGILDEAELTAEQFRWDVNGESYAGQVTKVCADKWEYHYIAWNMDGSNPFFTDRRVRRAMAHALDLDALRRAVSGGLYQPCSGIYHPNAWMANRQIKPFSYDPAEARRLLEAAGWHVGDEPDGVRVKDGRRFEFELLIPSERPSLLGLGLSIRQQLADVGVAVQLRSASWEQEFKPRMREGQFEALLSGVVPNLHPSRDFKRWTTKGEHNFNGYSNVEVDRLFDRARRAASDTEERRCYREIQRLIYYDQPYTFLWHKPTLWVFNKRVRGVELSAMGPVRFYPGPRAWWVAAESQ